MASGMSQEFSGLSGVELFREAQKGDQKIVSYLIQKYRYLISNRLLKSDEDIQNAYLGLWHAIIHYDASKGPFQKYAGSCIGKRVQDRKYSPGNMIPLSGKEKKDDTRERAKSYLKEVSEGLDEMEKVLLQERLEGYSYREITDMHGLVFDDVYRTVRKIIKKLEAVVKGCRIRNEIK